MDLKILGKMLKNISDKVPPNGRPRASAVPSTGAVPQGRPGQYPEFTMFGKPFTRINESTPPWMEKTQVALRTGLAQMAKVLPNLSSKMYTQAVLDRRTTPFTEADLSDQDVRALARVVTRAQRDGRSYVKGADNISPETKNGDAPFATALGRANYRPGAYGSVVVDDTYDFNNYEQEGGGGGAESSDGWAWLGRRAIPSGVRGMPVKITVPQEALEEAGYKYGLLPPVRIKAAR